MAERRARRISDRLSQRVYTLEPARPRLSRAIALALVCMLSAVAGAAAVTAWQARHAGVPRVECKAAPIDESQQATDLARARLALAEESAARAAVQTTADRNAAELARLTGELQFLRGQSRGAAAAQPASPGP
jgi:hypothetical protein